MRFFLTANKEFYNNLISLQKHMKDSGVEVTLKDVATEAVEVLFQIKTMLGEGYKLLLVSPDGKKSYIREGKKDEPRKDQGSDSEDFEG